MPRKPDATQKVTIRDVARKAKVSTATVSRVLSGVNVVSDDLAERVRAVARQLKYHPNRVARSLRSQKSRIVGVLIPNIQNPFFTGVIRGIEDLLQATDYTLLLGNSDDNPARERGYLDLLRAEGVGGLIVVPGADAAKTYTEILEIGIPVVAIDRFVADLQCDSVTVANEEGAAAAIRHLIALGHTRIGIVTGPEKISTARERLAGYALALREAKLPHEAPLIHHVVFRQEGGYEAATKLMSLPHPPTAIFAASDFIALGVLRALHDRRLHIPEDVAVVSFDDMPWAAALSPPLTAVSQPTYELGATAARLLLERMRDPDRALERVRLQTQLVVRASCGAKAGDPAGQNAIAAGKSAATDLVRPKN
ncbi:MAG: LacI family DNA-binding transcriptional regulator [Deltaproteobacteria bacterium]|nr:LacI family DNA-binding transcriptional regulator [Deltaproteobacteria bacterium]